MPCGTLFFDANTNKGVADLVEPGDRFLAARGGRGGRGNKHFATSRRKAPRFCEMGDMGEEIELRLELRLIADVGLVGLPNVGKSSILAAISNAQPKIANYPFTTLSPNLGVLTAEFEKIVIADIPGLIEGAHLNKGLGLEFLRHIDRSRLLIHVLSLDHDDFDKHIEDFETVRNEMHSYDKNLGNRPFFVVGNKIDMLEKPNKIINDLTNYFRKQKIQFETISALTGEGIPTLVDKIIKFTDENPRPQSQVRLYALEDFFEDNISEKTRRRYREKIEVVKLHGGGYKIINKQLEKAAERYDLSQDENVARFILLLRKHKVEQLLEAAGAEVGDTVSIGYKEFEFYPDYYPTEENSVENEVNTDKY